MANAGVIEERVHCWSFTSREIIFSGCYRGGDDDAFWTLVEAADDNLGSSSTQLSQNNYNVFTIHGHST